MKPFRLVYKEFPELLRGKMPGFTVEYKGTYSVFIDKDLNESERIETIKHELAHIALGHLEDKRFRSRESYLENLTEIEDAADMYADRMTDKELSELMMYQVS